MNVYHYIDQQSIFIHYIDQQSMFIHYIDQQPIFFHSLHWLTINIFIHYTVQQFLFITLINNQCLLITMINNQMFIYYIDKIDFTIPSLFIGRTLIRPNEISKYNKFRYLSEPFGAWVYKTTECAKGHVKQAGWPNEPNDKIHFTSYNITV